MFCQLQTCKLLCLFWMLHGHVAFASDMQPFDELYADGIEAYWNENWEGCIHYIETALINFRFMKEVLGNCSKKCADNINKETSAVSFIINKAACLENCERESTGQSGIFSRLSVDVLDEFKNKQPYVHLQFAYFRIGEFAKSLAITYTYTLYNSDNDMMNKNMEFYRNHQNATEDMFVNRDISSHIAAFDQGVEALHGEEYEAAIGHFEYALRLFYVAHDQCRAMCEGEYDGGPDFLERKSFHDHTVDHYKTVLECYMSCPKEAVRTTSTNHISNFVPNIYEILHYAYAEVADDENAAKCLYSYLLFFPDNEVFEKRKRFFDSNYGSSREDALTFSKQLNLQVSILKYIYQNFGIRDYDEDLLQVYKHDDDKTTDFENEQPPEEDAYSNLEEKQLDIIESKDEYNEEMTEIERKKVEKMKQQAASEDDADISHLLELPIGHHTVDSNHLIDIIDSSSVEKVPTAEGPVLFDSSLLANSTQMGGPLRFALDGFATLKDCQQLIDLELTGGITGDGYRGKSHPHTEHEIFHGITVHRAAKLAEKEEVPVAAAKLYYDLSEKVRQQVQAYFKLDHLYFDYTHLVCRTALNKDEDLVRKDNSHPIHGDNCILEPDGSCVKRDPAYTWRDYSAIMYLNRDFDGGQFVMTDHTARRVKVQVKPQCGRLVGFSAGKDCLHGVKPVNRGRRCAVALWFTLDRSYDEEQRKEAKEILDSLSINKDEL